MCITPTDVIVENSINQDWWMLGLRCWLVYDTDSAYNGVYRQFFIIVDNGHPIWSIARELWPCIIGNTIITYQAEYIWLMLNVCWYYNPITEPSYYDGGLVARLSISTCTGNIYKYLCRILQVLSNKVNRWLLFLYER